MARIVVKKINNTSPDANGNFTIEAGQHNSLRAEQGYHYCHRADHTRAHASSHASDGRPYFASFDRWLRLTLTRIGDASLTTRDTPMLKP